MNWHSIVFAGVILLGVILMAQGENYTYWGGLVAHPSAYYLLLLNRRNARKKAEQEGNPIPRDKLIILIAGFFMLILLALNINMLIARI
jgi:predicted Na+-dependent transporter